MALRAMYKGFKKVLAPLIINRPGELAIDQDAFNAELNSVFFPRSEQAVLGAKNLCPVISIDGRDSDSTLTYTVNTTDNTVEVNGTAAHAGWAVLANTTVMLPVLSRLAGKTIKFSGGLNNAKHLILRLKETSSSSNIDYVSYGSDVDVSVPSNIANYNRIEILLSININTVCSNDVLKPMISFDGGEYVPPAMTNKALTDDVATLNGSASDQKTTINAIITAATGAADFAAFKTAMGAITPVTRSIQVTPETREEITEPEENPVKKTTRKKSTAKADTEKEGE